MNVKGLFKIGLSLFILLAMVACDSFRTLNARKSAQGAPYEVLVVCNGRDWESSLGEALRNLFATPVPAINQNEPMFNVVRITANDFKGLLPSYRNILNVVVSPNVEQCAVLARYDVESAPQIVLTFQGPSHEAMIDYLNANGESLLQVLEIAERNRTIEFAEQHGVKALEDIVRKQFGVEMHIPDGYTLRVERDNFVWASHEYPTASQGFFLYTHPYNGKQSISAEALVKARNNAAQQIPGPSDGSYMTTVTRIPNIDNDGYVEVQPEQRVLRINGTDWVELRGFWEVENDFMGGPFVSYTTLDKRSGKLLTLDCYVYSPKYGKRNFLRALEHLVYCIDIPKANDTKE